METRSTKSACPISWGICAPEMARTTRRELVFDTLEPLPGRFRRLLRNQFWTMVQSAILD
jgi:hypothetical protein